MVINAGASFACHNCSFSDHVPTLNSSHEHVRAPVVQLRPGSGVWGPAQAWLTATHFAEHPLFDNAHHIVVAEGCRVYSDDNALRVRAQNSSANVGVWRTSKLAPGESFDGAMLHAASFNTENSLDFQTIMRVRSLRCGLPVRLRKSQRSIRAGSQ